MQTTLLTSLPDWFKIPLRRTIHFVKTLPYFGTGRYCPICGKSSNRFKPDGKPTRLDAQCAHCGALERHRLLILFLRSKTDLFDGKGKKLLHVAPEPCLEPLFRKHLGMDYLTADLQDPRAMVKMDICDIRFPDQSFDAIYCGHVLEHVPDDRKAMREFYRVIKIKRWAILTVPISNNVTFEDATIVDPQERLIAFGQEDHVRRYGSDFADRVRESGFTVESYMASDLADQADIAKMGLTHDSGTIYYCRKI